MLCMFDDFLGVKCPRVDNLKVSPSLSLRKTSWYKVASVQHRGIQIHTLGEDRFNSFSLAYALMCQSRKQRTEDSTQVSISTAKDALVLTSYSNCNSNSFLPVGKATKMCSLTAAEAERFSVYFTELKLASRKRFMHPWRIKKNKQFPKLSWSPNL